MLSAEVIASLVPTRRFWTIDIMTFLEGCVAQTASNHRRNGHSSVDTGFGEIEPALKAHSERSSFKG
jgi:hypothetical protein